MRPRIWLQALPLCLALACGEGGSEPTATPADDFETEGGDVAESPSVEAPEGTEPADAPAAETADLPAPMEAILEAHNRARAEHCAPPLRWSAELAEVAEGWAAELVSRSCPLQHSQGSYGENLFAATAGARQPADVVGVWVAEREHYRFAHGGFSMRTGHFTQVVWVGTERVGCATTQCDGLDLWVCNYDPPGNVRGGYPENVLPTSCER